MINEFTGIGNVGIPPILTEVDVNAEKRKVANMRVYFDRPVGQDYKDKGGYWLAVDLWGYRAEEAIRILKKGARVFLKGTLRSENWTDDQGNERTDIRLSADYFFMDTICIEQILYRNNKQSTDLSPAVTNNAKTTQTA